MRTSRVVSVLAGVIVAAVCLAGPSAIASGGALDTSFGDPGFGTDGTASEHCGCRYTSQDVLVDSSGAITQSTNTGGLIRYDENGHWDDYSSFAPTNPVPFLVRTLVDGSDRFTLAGMADGGVPQVVRLNNDGSRDASYGVDGVAQLDGVPLDRVRDAALATDGSVIVAGWNSATQMAVLVKITPAGNLDTTFNPTGPVPGTLTTPGYPWSVTVDAQGRVLVSLQMGGLGVWDMTIQRYEPDGSLDTAYGNAGDAVLPPGPTGTNIVVFRMLNGDSGDTFAVGEGAPDTGDHTIPVIIKLTSSGQPDLTFNGTGIQSTSLADTGGQQYREAASDGHGGLWATGSNSTGRPGSKFLSHINADGTYDQGFSNRGLYWYGGSDDVAPMGLAVAKDGDVLLGRKYTDFDQMTAVDKVKTSGLPAPTGASATHTDGGVTLSWTNPATQSFASAEVRYALGSTAPQLVTDGLAGYSGPGSSAQLTLPPSTDVGVAVFAHDYSSTIAGPLVLQLLGTGSAATASTTRTTYPGAVIISDTVTTSTTSSAVAGVTVALYARPHGQTTWNVTPVTTRTTNSLGAASASVVPHANTDYQWRFAGQGTDLYSNSPATSISMAPKISLTASRTTARRGTAIRLLGSVAPNTSGQVVYLQRYIGGWRTVTQVRLTTTSTYSFTVRPRTHGSYAYRVVKNATASQLKGVSRTARLKIT